MPRVSSTRSRTARSPPAASPTPNGRAPNVNGVRKDVAANGRPTRAARPRTVAPDDDDDDYLPPSPSPPAAHSPSPGFFSRSPSPAWAQVGTGRCKSHTSLPKKVPNMFMMYKNEFYRRYPEICILERIPTQRMRIVAHLWEREPPAVREHYERRYRNAMIAAGRKFAEKDMQKRKKRSRDVTRTRRAKRAAQGESLTKRSEAIIDQWLKGLRRSRLIHAVHNWEEANNWNVSRNSRVRQNQLQQSLSALADVEREAAEDSGSFPPSDEQPVPSPSQFELKAEDSNSPSSTTEIEGQFCPGSVEQEDLSRSPAHEVAPSNPLVYNVKNEICATPPQHSEQVYQATGSVSAANAANAWARYALNGCGSSPVQNAVNRDGNCRGAAVDGIAGLCHNLGCLDIKPTLQAPAPAPELPSGVEDCVMEDTPMAPAVDCNYLASMEAPSVMARTYRVPQFPAAKMESTLYAVNPVAEPAVPFTQQPSSVKADYQSPSPSDVLFFETMMFDEDAGAIKSEEVQPPSQDPLQYEQEVPVMLYSSEDSHWSRQCQDVLWDWNYSSLVDPALMWVSN